MEKYKNFEYFEENNNYCLCGLRFHNETDLFRYIDKLASCVVYNPHTKGSCL